MGGMIEITDLGEFIRGRRLAANMKSGVMAARVNIAQSTYSKIENGPTKLSSVNVLLRIADALGIRIVMSDGKLWAEEGPPG